MDYKYAFAGLVVWLLYANAKAAEAAKKATQDAVPLDGSNPAGNMWTLINGLGLGGAAGGVNLPNIQIDGNAVIWN
jgi:hypothetical protein